MNNPGSSSSKRVQDRTDRLNKNCFCVTLDLPSLREAMEREAGEPAFFETFIRPKAHLFSHVPVFLSATTVNEMRAIAVAVETTAQLEDTRPRSSPGRRKSRGGITARSGH